MRIRTFTAPAALVTGALLLTACGGNSPLEGKNGPDVAELAADALEEADAVHLAGTIDQDGQETEIDMQLQGDDASGTITVQDTEIELISVGGDVYLKATEDLLASFGAPAEAAEQFEGRWIMVPAEDAADFQEFTLDQFLEELRDGDYQDETSTDEVDGEDVVVVEQEDGPALSVKDDDPPYPLQMSDEDGTITFSNHGEEEDISAPEDVISPEELEGS